MRTYKDGERRVHKRIDIRYEATGDLWRDGSKGRWYIDMHIYETIGDNPPGKTRMRTRRAYFRTLTEAKQYIDDFEDNTW